MDYMPKPVLKMIKVKNKIEAIEDSLPEEEAEEFDNALHSVLSKYKPSMSKLSKGLDNFIHALNTPLFLERVNFVEDSSKDYRARVNEGIIENVYRALEN